MSGYTKLSGESFDFDYEDIQNSLKVFNTKLKEYQRSNERSKNTMYTELEKHQSRLQEIFSRPRLKGSDRAKLETLEKQYKELSSNFSKIKPNLEMGGESRKVHHRAQNDDFLDGIVEDESLVFHDVNQLNEKKLAERHEDVTKLQKDFIIVNDLFKDSAKLVGEQGDMLAASENNLMIAVELQRADVYQQKAKRKLGCIFIIAAVVVAVLLAIILGVVYT